MHIFASLMEGSVYYPSNIFCKARYCLLVDINFLVFIGTNFLKKYKHVFPSVTITDVFYLESNFNKRILSYRFENRGISPDIPSFSWGIFDHETPLDQSHVR